MLMIYDNTSFFNYSPQEKGLLVAYDSYLDFINQIITPLYWSLIFIKTCLGSLFALAENLSLIGRYLCGEEPWNQIETLSHSKEQICNHLKELSLTVAFGSAMIFNSLFAILSRAYVSFVQRYHESNQFVDTTQYQLQGPVVYI